MGDHASDGFVEDSGGSAEMEGTFIELLDLDSLKIYAIIQAFLYGMHTSTSGVVSGHLA